MGLIGRIFAGCAVMVTVAFIVVFLATLGISRITAHPEVSRTWQVPWDGSAPVDTSVDLFSADVRIGATLPAGQPLDGATLAVGEAVVPDPVRIQPDHQAGSATRPGRLSLTAHDPSRLPDWLEWFKASSQQRWDIAVNPQAARNLAVTIDRGSASVDLTGLPLSSFDLSIRAGEADITIGPPTARQTAGSVSLGLGSATMHIPTDTPVLVRWSGGATSVDASSDLARVPEGWANDAWLRQESTSSADRTGVDVAVSVGGGSLSLVSTHPATQPDNDGAPGSTGVWPKAAVDMATTDRRRFGRHQCSPSLPRVAARYDHGGSQHAEGYACPSRPTPSLAT